MKHILLFFLFASAISAQTHNGQKIKVNDNGTWEYENPNANSKKVAGCEYETYGMDESNKYFKVYTNFNFLTSENLKISDEETIENFCLIKASLRRVNTTKVVALQIGYQYGDFLDLFGFIEKDSELQILFEDNSVIYMHSIGSVFASSSEHYSLIKPFYAFNYETRAEDYDRLASLGIKKIKIKYSKGGRNIEIKNTDLFKQLANCLK